jgi:beta-glucosidase
MKRLLLLSVLAFSLLGYAQSLPIYLDESKPMEARIDDALSRMTLEEKVAMCHAQSKFSPLSQQECSPWPGCEHLPHPSQWAQFRIFR